MNLPQFSVKNSIFGNMLTIAVFVAGLYAAITMNRDLFPVTELDIVVVRTIYRNASAAEVENQITTVLEEEIRSVDGIKEFTSTSTESVSVIGITIDPDEKYKERVINNISRKVDRVKNLPDGAEKPDIEIITTKHDVIHVTVSGDVTEHRLREYADQLKSRLEALDGVASVNKQGWRDPEVWVEVDPEVLIKNELSLDEVVAAVARQNVNMPGGKMQQGPEDIVIRTVGEFESLKDIESVVVRSNPDGKHLTVGDIGTTRDTFSDNAVIVRANGSRGIILDVRKRQSGDAITTADIAEELVLKVKEEITDGITLGLLDFESYVIKRRLRVLLGNGLMGLILVLCSLPLVLNFRLAIVTALGIPFAFLVTILIMSTVGITINMITMFAIILVIGMLVDDAIIVAENVFRHIEEGKTPYQAAMDGATEVMWPVTATILTTIAAFVPLMFLPGIWGKVLKWVPIIVIITLSASLFEALVILPCHISEFVRVGRNHKKPHERRIWKSLTLFYGRLLDRVMKHRFFFVMIVFVAFAGAVLMAKTVMKVEIFPSDLIEIFTVNITMPQGTNRDATEAAVAQVESIIQDNTTEDELKNIVSYVGNLTDMDGAFVTVGSRYASMFVYLTPTPSRDRSAREIMDDLRSRCSVVDTVERLKLDVVKGGPPTGKSIDIKVVGEDYETLDKIAEEMKTYMATVTDVIDIEDDYELGKEEVRIVVDRPAAARLGVSVESVARTIYTAFEGMPATVVRSADDETKIRVRLAEPYRNMEKYLFNLRIRNDKGRLIELSKVAKPQRTRAIGSMFHYKGERAVSVTAGVKGGTKNEGASTAANKAIWEKFKDVPDRYPGYRITRTGEWEEQEEIKWAMLQAGLTSLLLIYTILVIQFKSFSQPFVVLTSIPFGMIGVLLALAIHGKPISIMAMLGMVGMTGVVVNDAIVLVSFINNLRAKGVPAQDAICQAAKTRFRPIVLTSVTTVLGMAPVIYGIGGYEPFVAPAAIVLAYGLVFATLLTLLVVPCFYSLGVDLRKRLGMKPPPGTIEHAG